MAKLVRKTTATWYSLILDWLLEISENLSLVDWDKLSGDWIVLIGCVLNLLHWFTCSELLHSQRGSSSNVFVDKRASAYDSDLRRSSPWRSHAMQSTAFLWILLSFINTWYCFSRHKQYQLRQKADPWSTLETERAETTLDKAEEELEGNCLKLLRYLLHGRQATSTAGTTVLTSWNPSKVSLRTFAVFSPVHALFIWSMPQNPAVLVFLGLMSLQSLYLIKVFDQYVEDKRLIYGQVFTEYETSFVQPRLGVLKRDVGVGTRPDDNGVYVEVHTPKVGIIDAAKTVPGVPRSASQIRMHDWERPVAGLGKPFPASPNVWAQSPAKPAPSVRRTIASPIKIHGSPSKMFKPASWTSGSLSANPFVQHQQESSGMKKSKTTSSLASRWD